MKSAIIEWNTDIDVIDDLTDNDRREIFKRLLKGKINVLWQGQVCKKYSRKDEMEPPYIELKKNLDGVDILLRIGYDKPETNRSRWHRSAVDGIVVKMGMNGKAIFRPDDYTEMSYAVSEATGVLNALRKSTNEN